MRRLGEPSQIGEMVHPLTEDGISQLQNLDLVFLEVIFNPERHARYWWFDARDCSTALRKSRSSLGRHESGRT